MTGTSVAPFENSDCSQRIDKWLWHSRFFKSRSAAARFVVSGKVRVNSRLIAKSSHALKQSDVLTFVLYDMVMVVRVRAIGLRRGPPSEAQSLYEDLSDARHGFAQRPLAPASHRMLDGAHGQSDTSSVHAATG